MSGLDLDQFQQYMQVRFDEIIELIKMGLANDLIANLQKDLAEFPFKDSDELYLQVSGKEWRLSDWRAKAIEAFLADGHKEHFIEKVDVYIKPEEEMAYYVINDHIRGSFKL